MLSLFVTCLIFSSVIISGDIPCTFSRSTKIIICGNQQCSADTDDTPIGDYKLGAIGWNSGKSKYWLDLYPKKKTGDRYWNYYYENPDTGRSKIALHPDSVSQGRISVPNTECWSKLETLFMQQVSSSFTVTGVKRSGLGPTISFSCSGNWAAGSQIEKTVSVIGSLQVTN